MLATDTWNRIQALRGCALLYAGYVWDYPGRSWEVRLLGARSAVCVLARDGIRGAWLFFRFVNMIQSAVQSARQSGAVRRSALRYVDELILALAVPRT